MKMNAFVSAILIAGLAGAVNAMELKSTDIQDGQTMANAQVFNGFGCSGDNISPQLTWSDPPDGTKSYVIMAYDPDAPTGSGWWHWTAFNIPATVTSLEAGAGAADKMPAGSVLGRTDFGTSMYGGPCPPEGATPHHYIFTVYALGIDSLPLDSMAPGAMVGFYARANALGEASITALYGR